MDESARNMRQGPPDNASLRATGYTINGREPRTLHEALICLDEAEKEVAALRKRNREVMDGLEYSLALESALRGLLACAEDAHWPLRAEHMLPMMQARSVLKSESK